MKMQQMRYRLVFAAFALLLAYVAAWVCVRQRRLSVSYHLSRVMMVKELSPAEGERQIRELRQELATTAPVEFWGCEGDRLVYYFFLPIACLDTALTGRRVQYRYAREYRLPPDQVEYTIPAPATHSVPGTGQPGPVVPQSPPGSTADGPADPEH